jgi:hypothetical protein
MTALSNLPTPEARQACVALSQHTVWPAEEWAIATRRLLDNNLPMDEMGMEMLIRLTLAVKDAPSQVADRMVLEYKDALCNLSQAQGLQSL